MVEYLRERCVPDFNLRVDSVRQMIDLCKCHFIKLKA
jgi:hypothetical protein